jgi:Crp-like helix-turn-helix domain
MWGVRREGVTVAAGRLQDSGAISYVRGHIKILDRKKLEETVCECYAWSKSHPFGTILLRFFSNGLHMSF